jgi:hypothetical protein
MLNYTRGTPRQQNEVFNEVRRAPNYKGKIQSRPNFDPFGFSLRATQAAVRDALASKGSVRTGPKMNNFAVSLEALNDPTGPLLGGLRAAEAWTSLQTHVLARQPKLLKRGRDHGAR